MQFICETGGVAVLAHPWALKNPVAIVRRLKDAGLHGIEVYRSDGRLAGNRWFIIILICVWYLKVTGDIWLSY